MEEMELGSEIWKAECGWNSVIRRFCVVNACFKKEKRKVTYSSGGNKTEIGFVLMEKESKKSLKSVKVIPWEMQHRLVVVDVKKENLVNCIKMKQNMQWRV